MAVIISLSTGFSLKKWLDAGLLSRELDYICHLGSNLHQDVIIQSYGTQELEEKILHQYIADNSIVANVSIKCVAIVKLCRYDDLINSFVAPFMRDIKPHSQNVSFIRSNQFTGSWTGWMYSLRYRCPFVLRMGYKQSAHYRRDHPSKILQFLFIYAAERFLVLVANKVIVTTPAIATIRENKKYALIPNSINLSRFKPIDNQKKFDVITISRLSEQKNLEMLIKACIKNNRSLLIIGQGPLEDKLKRLYFSESRYKIHHIKTIDNDEVPHYFSLSRIFALISFYEGNPKAAIEALSCNMSCLFSSIPSLQNLPYDSNGVSWADPSDFSQIDLALNCLLLTNSNSFNHREFVSKECSMSLNSKKEAYHLGTL